MEINIIHIKYENLCYFFKMITMFEESKNVHEHIYFVTLYYIYTYVFLLLFFMILVTKKHSFIVQQITEMKISETLTLITRTSRRCGCPFRVDRICPSQINMLPRKIMQKVCNRPKKINVVTECYLISTHVQRKLAMFRSYTVQ